MHEPRIRALIADDEANARALIREYLEDYPEIEVVGECANGLEAADVLSRVPVDLLFLDIEMPGRDGFEVLEQLTDPPVVIFSTAHGTHAVRAFEVYALDYLLKPYDRRRFASAVEKVLAPAAPVAPTAPSAHGPPDRLLVRDGRRIVPVRTEDILWLEAAGDYCVLHAGNASILCARGLGELEQRLSSQRFLRVHRSAVVNLDHLVCLEKDGHGGMLAHLAGGTVVRVSRSCAAELRSRVV